MLTIIQGEERVKRLLGTQKLSSGEYRLSRFCVETEVEDGVLLFNQTTRQLIHLPFNEREKFVSSREAVELWFAVPMDFDEQKLVRSLREQLRTRTVVPTDIYLFHIFTTVACICRCAYCFERGNQTCGSMSVETAEKVAHYIMRHKPKDEKTLLAWFGGEPLLNVSAIDIISKVLNQNAFEYDAIMATNAFLINDEIIDKAKYDWHMLTWNITIDGTEDVYNATKNYVVSCESPYKQVISNIKKLLKAGFRVNIRLNLGTHNSDDLIKLVDELYSTFGRRDNFCVYCATLYERQLEELDPRSPEDELIVRTKERELYDKVVSLGLLNPRLSQELKVYRCNPDMGWAVSILPDGRIGWCEDYVDKKVISHIDSEEFDIGTINSFKEQYDDLPECSVCPLYPDCVRLTKCDIDTPWCSEQKREVKLHKIKTAMKNEYRIFKK